MSTVVTRLVCAGLAGAFTAFSFAGAPERTPSGATLVVSGEHAALGTVYFVEAGPDVQVTFTSDAPVERIVGTSSAVVGYAVVASDPASAGAPIVAGAFRLPIASFETGIPLRNEHLRSDRWMDAATHPDVHFVLNAFENAVLVKSDEAKGFATWEGEFDGEMTIKGVAHPFRVPARVSLLDLGDNRQVRGGGKKLAIRCRYSLQLSDFGVGVNEQIMGTRLNDEITLDQFLLLSPRDPDASARASAEMRRFNSLLTRERDADGAYAMAPALVEANWNDASALNTLANWVIADNAARTDMALAFRCAMRANELTESKDAMVLDTVASLHHKAGDLTEAIAWQRKAVEAITDQTPQNMAGAIRANLARFEAEAGD